MGGADLIFETVAYTPNWRAVRRFLDARAERAAGRARAKRPVGLARLASEANATT
jgi:hypothetical protein